MAIPAPTPKFAIGDTIWVSVLDQTTKTLPCPDCEGAEVWKLTAPTGVEHEVDCPRCRAPGWGERLPSLSYVAWKGNAAARKITGVEVTTLPFHGDSGVRYQCYTGPGGGYVVDEPKAHAEEASALAEAEAQAAAKNAEIEARADVLEKRRFSTVKWDEARFDEFKNGLWTSFYALRDLTGSIRGMLEEEPSASDMRESLEDFLKFSVGQYGSPTPLEKAVRAAEAMVAEGTASDDLKAALADMPAPMRTALKADRYDDWTVAA